MNDHSAPDPVDAARSAHVPVMLARTADLLKPVAGPGSVLVDCTLGMGGHTEALLAANPDAQVVGIDRDQQALDLATARLTVFGDRFHGFRGGFDESDRILDAAGVAAPAAYLFDLGVSSLQLDSDERGFAYARETPLDMRMDGSNPLSAADVLNSYSGEELARVFYQYGEERHARRISAAVVAMREQQPLRTSHDLTQAVEKALPAGPRRSGHPAKRVFQALRIEVNDELGALRRGLTAAIRRVAVGGRIVVMSYHSLEDRIVKRAFASGAESSAPADLPVVPDEYLPFLTLLGRGAEQASEAEIAENPRAKPVRLRAVSKIASVPDHWQGAA